MNTLFIGLLILWAILLFGGFLTGKPNPEKTHRIPTPARMGASFILVIFAWLWHFNLPPELAEATTTLALTFAIGMTCGFIGDLFMANNITIGGIAAFGIGHISYIIGLIHFANTESLTEYQLPALLAFWLIALILWYLVVFRGASTRELTHYLALPYALLLATTTGLAAALALQSILFIPVAIGALLFLLSDLLLAAQLFNDLHFTGIGDAVWLMYSPGQMLIVAGAFLHFLAG